LFKHFIFCKLIVVVCYSRLAATRDRRVSVKSDDKTLAIQKIAVRMMGVRAWMANIGLTRETAFGPTFSTCLL